MPKIWRTSTANIDEASIEAAGAVLAAGGVIAYPTDTLYALGVDPWRPEAVMRLFAIKGRDPGMALPLVASDLPQAESRLGKMSPLARRLAAAFWPGPLTLIVPAPTSLPAEVTGGGRTVAVRVPNHEVARALARYFESPLTATSANRTGRPAPDDPDIVLETLGAHLDGLLDAGRTSGGQPSTLVDVTGEEPRLVRAGAVPWERVVQSIRA